MAEILDPAVGTETKKATAITAPNGHERLSDETGATQYGTILATDPTASEGAIQGAALKYRSPLLNYLDSADDTKELYIVALHQFMNDVGFKLDEKPVETISDTFRRALDGERGEGVNGFAPAVTNVSQYLRAKESLECSDSKKSVIGLSVGGTNAKAGLAEVSGGIVDIKEVESKNLKTDSMPEGKTESDFWKTVLPKNFLNWIKSVLDGGETPNVSLTLGYPIAMIPGKADGKIMHLAGKGKFPAMAPFDANESEATTTSAYPTIAESFCRYLAENEIELDQSCVAVSPNDTVSAAFANGPTFINGTGTNACVITADGKVINTELGHFEGMDSSLLDTVVASPIDFEKLVSGKILGDIFKYTISVLLGDDRSLAQKLQAMSNEEACAFLFSLYPADSNLHAGEFTQEERLLLWNIALFFVERASNFIAKIGKGIEDATGQKSTYAIEGSVFTKNPFFVSKINEAFRSYGGTQSLLEHRQLPVSEASNERFGEELDGSFVGTFVYGACIDEANKKI